MNDFTREIDCIEETATKILPEENLDDLCQELESISCRVAARMAFRGGFRVSELFEMKWCQLTLKEEYWMAEVGGRETRIVPLIDDKLYVELKQLRNISPSSADKDEILTFEKETFRQRIHQASDGELTPHLLRLSAAHNLASKGFSAKYLSWFFGFKRTIAKRYIRDSPKIGEVEEK